MYQNIFEMGEEYKGWVGGMVALYLVCSNWRTMLQWVDRAAVSRPNQIWISLGFASCSMHRILCRNVQSKMQISDETSKCNSPPQNIWIIFANNFLHLLFLRLCIFIFICFCIHSWMSSSSAMQPLWPLLELILQMHNRWLAFNPHKIQKKRRKKMKWKME